MVLFGLRYELVDAIYEPPHAFTLTAARAARTSRRRLHYRQEHTIY